MVTESPRTELFGEGTSYCKHSLSGDDAVAGVCEEIEEAEIPKSPRRLSPHTTVRIQL